MILETEFSRKKGALWQRYGSSIARDLPATRVMVAAFRFWVLARNRVFKKKLGFNAKGSKEPVKYGQKPSFQEKRGALYGSSIALIIHSLDHSLFTRVIELFLPCRI